MRGHLLDQVVLLRVSLASKILTADEMLEDFFPLVFILSALLLSAVHRGFSMAFHLSSDVFLFFFFVQQFCIVCSESVAYLY